ncbi:hypothetical protein RYX36_006516, partial [Vicia faba]
MKKPREVVFKVQKYIEHLLEEYSKKYKVVIKYVSRFRLHSNIENSREAITGLDIILRHHADKLFTLKKRGDKEDISVFEYFTQRKMIPLKYSGNYPCINVGKPQRPIYLPIE